MTNQESFIIDYIKNVTKDVLIKCDVDGYRPIKNTTKEDCYEALYKIMYLMRRLESQHGGFTHE